MLIDWIRLSRDEPARLDLAYDESARTGRRLNVIGGTMYGQHRKQYCADSGLPSLFHQHSDRPSSTSNSEHSSDFITRAIRNICRDRRTRDIWDALGTSGGGRGYSHCRIRALFDRTLWRRRWKTSRRSRSVGRAIPTLSQLVSVRTGGIRVRFEHVFLTAYQKVAAFTRTASICDRDRTARGHGAVSTCAG